MKITECAKNQENMHKNFFQVYNKSQSPCEQDDGMGNQKLLKIHQ